MNRRENKNEQKSNKDVITPEHVIELHKQIANSELTIIPDGHWQYGNFIILNSNYIHKKKQNTNYMKNIILITLTVTLLFSTSCKKNYTCSCTNPGGTIPVFSLNDSKKNATAKCKDYYNSNYSNIPFNETSCSIN